MKSDTPKVSIIVPVYKVEAYIEKCIDSILRQTLSDFECILVDDGSPDNCGEICDRYAQKDKRIRVIHKKNGGLSDARNAGLDIARGEYIGFVDSDDFIHPQMYEVLYRVAKNKNADYIRCGVKDVASESESVVSDKLDVNKITESAEIYSTKYVLDNFYNEFYECRKIRPGVWCKIYNAAIFDDLRFKKDIIYEDEEILLHILAKTKIIAFIPYELYYYNQYSPSILRSPFSEKNYTYIERDEEKVDFFKNNKRQHGYALNKYARDYSAFAIITDVYRPEYKELFRSYKNEMKRKIAEIITDRYVRYTVKCVLFMTFVNSRFIWNICQKLHVFDVVYYWNKDYSEEGHTIN